MHFNEHSDLAGQHAFLSPSGYHWINYDDDKLADRWVNAQAARRGVELHAYAQQAIRLGVRQARNAKTLNAYINDAIGFRMTPEQVLFYSPNCYGTTDALGFANNVLRVHDLKTGLIPGSIHQLEVYASLFCLEYGVKPGSIEMILRIYQNDQIIEERPDVDTIAHIMSKIIVFDHRITELQTKG